MTDLEVTKNGGFNKLKAHPFFSNIDFDNVETIKPPNLKGGNVSPSQIDAEFKHRKYSMLLNNEILSKKYLFSETQLDVIYEADNE